jgi:hypothetical protein
MQQIPQENYDRAMKALAQKFQEALKESLAKPYPFAPGFNKGRTAFGVRNMKVKTGNLYKSIKVEYSTDSNEIVVSMADYWRFVNEGRKPGKYVPIKPLMAWIRAKGFNKNKTTGKFEKFNIKGMAFGVSKNIFKFGIAPTYFYDEAFQIFETAFEDDAIRALGIDVANFFDKVVEENLI